MNEIATTSRHEGSVSLAPLPIDRVLGAIIAAAENPAVDVAKMKELFALQKELLVMQGEIEFNRSLMRLPPIRVPKNGRIDLTSKDGTKRGSVPFAKWEDMASIVEPMLQAEGFRLMFTSDPRPGEGGGLIVTGTLLHAAGHCKVASIPLPLDTGPGRNNVQAMGSSLSYGRRYVTEMLLNIVREGADDDGKAAGTKFIPEHQADELRALAKEVGRQEGPFLDQLFAGQIRSFDELEEGAGYMAARSTLEALRRRQTAKKDA